MEHVLADLDAEHRDLERLLRGLSPDQWAAPTRCPGWDVADVVLHLSQTDEMAVASLTDGPSGPRPSWTEELAGVDSVDDGAALLVARERGLPNEVLLERWVSGAATLVELLDGRDLSTRVTWVTGQLSARTLATTRLAEAWIHGGDVAAALGISRTPTDRLGPIARLAWRTLPYAFVRAGLAPPGPVAFHLVSPTGVHWDFEPDEPATTSLDGPAAELCEVAARRVEPSATRLIAEGPDGAAVLSLVRTYA
ncbi:MAG: maleylpyruvate isomerase family mycothiol-dependent enzyme [Acidimicrobiales bacterium]